MCRVLFLPHSSPTWNSTCFEFLQVLNLQVGLRSGMIMQWGPPTHPPGAIIFKYLGVSNQSIWGVFKVSGSSLDGFWMLCKGCLVGVPINLLCAVSHPKCSPINKVCALSLLPVFFFPPQLFSPSRKYVRCPPLPEYIFSVLCFFLAQLVSTSVALLAELIFK